MGLAAYISDILGVIYVTSWSLSFYPQVLLNLRRHSTSGTTIAYPLLNVLGFSAYTIYTAVFLLSPVIRKQYAIRHPVNSIPAISPWDLAFAAHGVILVAATLSQFWGHAIWRWKDVSAEEERDTRRINVWVWVVFAAGIAGVVGVIIIVLAGPSAGHDANGWAYIDIVYALSYLKIYVTFTKYTPQVIHNARRRSTHGWSIGQVLFDFLGGVASVVQLFVDAYRFSNPHHGGKDWRSGVMGNMVKFLLGNMSMAFDLMFIVQHYLLYGAKHDTSAWKDGTQTVPPNTVPVEGDRLGNDERRPLLEENHR